MLGIEFERLLLPRDEHLAPRVAAIASAIPTDVLSPFGFEIRLGGNDQRVDFGGAVVRGRAERLGRASGTVTQNGTVWRTLATFAQAWSNPIDELDQYIPYIGLEFDLTDDAPDVPAPSVFALFDWPIGIDPENDARLIEGAALRTLALLLGDAFSDQHRCWVSSCLRRLPAEGRVLSVGVMLGRMPTAVRVFACVPPDDLNRYLADVGWRGDRDAVDRFVSTVEDHLTNDVVQFQVDSGELGLDRIGIEFSYLHQPDAPRRWSTLGDWLRDVGLCSTDRRADPPAGPAVIEHDSRRLLREISHVKVVLGAGVPLAAKAYLSVTPL